MKLETSEGERDEWSKIAAGSDVGTDEFMSRLLRDIDTLLAEVERPRGAPPAPPLPADVEEMRERLEARVAIIEAFIHEINASPGGEHEKLANELRSAASLLSRWPGGQASEPPNE